MNAVKAKFCGFNIKKIHFFKNLYFDFLYSLRFAVTRTGRKSINKTPLTKLIIRFCQFYFITNVNSEKDYSIVFKLEKRKKNKEKNNKRRNTGPKKSLLLSVGIKFVLCSKVCESMEIFSTKFSFKISSGNLLPGMLFKFD